MYYLEPEPLRQLSVKLTPTRTVYTFGNETVELRVTFTGSLLLDDLDLMSRPASYVFYEVRSVDGQAHEVTVYLDISSQAAVNESSTLRKRRKRYLLRPRRGGHADQIR